MAEVRVSLPHSLPIPDAIQRIKSFEDMISKYGISAEWKGSRADLKGAAASGSIEVTPQSATVVVKLGIFAKAAGVDPVKLEGSIRKRLEAAFQT